MPDSTAAPNHDRSSTCARPTIWLCGACGKTGPTRETVGDESCWMWSVTVYVDSIQRDATGRIIGAQATPGGGRP